MKYILRTLWLIGYIPVFIVEVIGAILCLSLVYLMVAAYYFIKTENLDGMYENPLIPILWFDDKYKILLDKIESYGSTR